jgi:two-component system sensor histidine kinase YesM
MRNTTGIATIGSEVRMLKEYARIMEFQYMNQFRLELRVDSRVEDYLAPVLFLQPLVENSLIHGRNATTTMLTICVSAHLVDDHVAISVEDNGEGMSTGRLREISMDRETNIGKMRTFTSIGIANIRERMALLYRNKPFSVDIASVKNQGTVVRMCLPLVKEIAIDEENTSC